MKRDEFARNLAAGTYDLIVLDVLRDGPSYGYGIRRRIFEQSKHTLRWQDGTIYPVLRHLEQQGLVASSWKRSRGGRERRYYRLTPARPPGVERAAPAMERLHPRHQRPARSVMCD